MSRKYVSLLAASWLVLSTTAFANGFESSNWNQLITADHSGGDDQGSNHHQSDGSSQPSGSSQPGGLTGLLRLQGSFGSDQSSPSGSTPAGNDQKNSQFSNDNHSNHGDDHQNDQHAADGAQQNAHSVSGNVYNDVYGDHHGLINALSHVKNPHAIAVLQAILNGLNPSTVAKSVYQTVSQTVYEHDDSHSVSGQVYSGGAGGDSVSDDRAALTIIEQDTEDNKTDLSNAFSKVADRLMQQGDLTTSRQALEDSVSADPTNNTSYQKLGQVLNQTGSTTINTYVNGKQPVFDVQPFIQNDSTLVPIRSISEALGAQVDWNDTTQTATFSRNGHTIQLTIGDSHAIVDGQTVPLDTPAELKDDHTFVPVRFLSQAFGANVQWFPVGQIVDITLQQ